MIQNCQDALAINHYHQRADLFLTATANPKWPKIQEALLPGQSASDRPDIICCVFHFKMAQLIKDIYEHGIIGCTVAQVWTNEFQKKGLPHMHMVIFLHPDHKLCTPEDVDSLLLQSFQMKNEGPELFELVKTLMVHTPCGPKHHNADAPCPVNGKCSKSFPKSFRDQTTVNDDSYANLQRCDTGKTFEVRGHQVNNLWVVAHCHYLIYKYHCHINVESIALIKAIKYISTRAMITLQWSLVTVRMRLSSILILNMSLPVRVFGIFSISICTRKAHQWSVSKSILKVNK